jgi:hypothetical protein
MAFEAHDEKALAETKEMVAGLGDSLPGRIDLEIQLVNMITWGV